MEDLTVSDRRVTDAETESPPPFFRTWRRLYAFLLLELIVLIVLFRLLTVVFE